MEAYTSLAFGSQELCCDFCSGKEFRQLHAWPVGDRWNPATIPIAVWKCAVCDLVILHPVPLPHQLPDRGEWWAAGRPRFRRRRWLKRIRESVRNALWATPHQSLIRATIGVMPSGKLLDIGCGRGGLLEVASPYYECWGLEPSPLGAEQTRERGFPVIEDVFERAEIQTGDFDVIVMDSVIEHVTSPRIVLAKANRVLRPDGVLVLKTPKFGGPAYRMHGRKWNGFRHGYHTMLFTGATLGAYLESTGFEVLRRPRRDQILDDVLILWARKIRDSAKQHLPARGA